MLVMIMPYLVESLQPHLQPGRMPRRQRSRGPVLMRRAGSLDRRDVERQNVGVNVQTAAVDVQVSSGRQIDDVQSAPPGRPGARQFVHRVRRAAVDTGRRRRRLAARRRPTQRLGEARLAASTLANHRHLRYHTSDILVLKLISGLVFILFSSQNFYYFI